MDDTPRLFPPPAAAGTEPVPPPRRARPPARLRPIVSRPWLALFSLMILLTGGTAITLIRMRVIAIERTMHSLATERLLNDALLATQRLRLAATWPAEGVAAQTMDQDLLLLSDLTRIPVATPLPGYQPTGPETGGLRALLLPALGDLRALRAEADGATRMQQRLALLDQQIATLRSQAAMTAARQAAHLANTTHIPVMVRTLIAIMTLLLVVFLVMLLRRAAALRATHGELSAWADDTARLLAAIPGVLVRSRKDSKGNWVRGFVGEAMTRLTGHSIAEAKSEAWLRRNIPAEDLPALLQAFDEALAGTPRSATLHFRHKDGHWIWVKLMMGRHLDGDGTPELLTLWSDATREQEVSERLAHTAKLAHMGELMTGMAHEMNQPLTSISLAAENATRLAEREPLDRPRLQAKLDVVVKMAARAAGLVERLREFVREDETPKAPLRLEAVVGGAMQVMANRLRLAGVAVRLDIPAGLPEVLGRATPLERVFTQVMANACDAYAALVPPCPTPTLAIIARVEGKAMRVAIQDQGGGIPPELLPRLFEPFFTTKPVGSGTGLGLSSSFGIMAEIGGSITAENAHGGARFTLLLPLA